jgi:hypothetical protein
MEEEEEEEEEEKVKLNELSRIMNRKEGCQIKLLAKAILGLRINTFIKLGYDYTCVLHDQIQYSSSMLLLAKLLPFL